MGKVRGPYLCGLDAAVDVVGGKWKPLILWGLYDAEGPLRFGELRREVVGVSEKMLIQQLRELEADGIVHREVYAEVPPRVEYSLTEVGAQLNAALGPLGEWGFQHMESIVARKHPGYAATAVPSPTTAPAPGSTAAPRTGSAPVPAAAPGPTPAPEPSTTGSTTAPTAPVTPTPTAPVTSTAPARRADAVQRGGAAAGPARVDHPRRAGRPLRAPGVRTPTTPRTGQGEPGGQG
ncbi:transcriptional regulator, HxlR family [Streptomyces sp. AmelKG-E11A]|nr:transcriptional regulator, HxlR family [Streptomyces sp. AmelKG-E11A]